MLHYNSHKLHKARIYSTILLLLCLCTNALAYDYSHCIKYFKSASSKVNDTQAISLKNGNKQHHLLYSPTYPNNVKVLKADPFIGLYLVDMPKTKLSYQLLPLDKRTLNDKNLAFISQASKPSVGRITKRQSGFLQYAKFSNTTTKNSVLGNICYQIYGIGIGNDNFIEKKYIDRFLNQKSVYYGDLGIRFASSKPIVAIIDPFLPNNPFRPQDEIISINGTKVSTSNDVEWLMSNLKPNAKAKVVLKRDNKRITLNAPSSKRYGGFLLKETFLERFGIDINDVMEIESIDSSLAGRFSVLREKDRIIWINKEPIITDDTDTALKRYENLKLLLSKTPFEERFEGKIQLLIVRDNLEIFVKI